MQTKQKTEQEEDQKQLEKFLSSQHERDKGISFLSGMAYGVVIGTFIGWSTR